MKCADCRFVVTEVSKHGDVVFACGNKKSEYHLTALNVSLGGYAYSYITWPGCALGEAKPSERVETIQNKSPVAVCRTCERGFKGKTAKAGHCHAYTAMPASISLCWTDDAEWFGKFLEAKRNYLALKGGGK